RQVRAHREVAGEGARRLRPRSVAPLEVERQAENDRGDLEFREYGDERVHVLLECSARQRPQWRGEPPFDVRHRKSDRLGAEVEADEAALRRKARGEVFDGARAVHADVRLAWAAA